MRGKYWAIGNSSRASLLELRGEINKNIFIANILLQNLWNTTQQFVLIAPACFYHYWVICLVSQNTDHFKEIWAHLWSIGFIWVSIIPNYLNSFLQRILTFKVKLDVNMLIYSFNDCGCEGHTLTQEHSVPTV